MANQALIQAAQRMYSAKAAKAERDISPILQAGLYTTQKINTAIEQKRERQQEEAAKETESFKDILLKNDKIRPELTSKLQDLQDQYFENLKISEGIFVGRDKKNEAIEANNKIANQLRKYESQLRTVDINKAITNNTSKANFVGDQVDDVVYRDKSLADNLIFKDDGIYYINHKNEEVSLDDYKRPIQVYAEGITGMVETLGVVQKAGLEGMEYEGGVEEAVENNINTYLRSSNYKSLLFDDIGTYNWAEQQLLEEFGENSGVELVDGEIKIIEGKEDLVANNIEELKLRVEREPDKYKEEFKKDYKDAMSKVYQNSLSKYEAKQQEVAGQAGESRTYNTALGYYDKNGLRGLVQGVKDGFVSFGKDQDYRKFEDGKFYLTDTEGNKLSENDKGLTENEIFSKLRITGYLDMFDFGTATEEQDTSASFEAFNLSQQRFDEFISGDMPAENELGFARNTILVTGLVTPEEMKKMTNEEIISMVKDEYQSFMDIKNASEKIKEEEKDTKLSDIADTISSTETKNKKGEETELERIERRMKELVEYHGSSVTRRTNPLSVSQAKYSRLKKKKEKLLNK